MKPSPNPRNLSTAAAAAVLGVKPATLNSGLWRHGHYLGIKPARLPNGRLLWPADQVEAVASGARAAEAPDFSARLSAGRAAAMQ